ncbi:MAG TPA: ferredoxin reductase [Haliangiales bacterium]|nr:ferredoxin reductase [Haliangiales bacterium]
MTERAPRIPWRTAEVLEVVAETPRARSLVLRVPDWPGHDPGQHVDVRLTAEDGYQAQRSYSIASPPERPELVLTVERIDDGEVSPYLADEARPGDRFELRGPIGGYFTWTSADGGPLQLLAGGSGVVPLMAMLRHRARRGAPAAARLLYSSRSWETLIYRDELERLARDDARLGVAFALTRAAPPGWTGPRRRVDADMLRELAFDPAERPRAYLCGPTPFVESVATALVALGHAPERIKTERFGPTGGQT